MKRKILIGFIENGKAGGVDRYLLNFFKAVQGDNVQIDFLTNKVDEELQKMLSQKGSRLFQIASLKHPIRQYHQVRQLIQKYKYDTVYLNISTAIDCAAAWAAWQEKVPNRILHSHAAGNDCASAPKRFVFNVLHYMCRSVLHCTGTKFCACSRNAGNWMFPRKIVESERFQVVFNAVDTEKFQFDEKERKIVRDELELQDAFVVGHAGNFCDVKNYPFLLEVFAVIARKIPKAKLILVGTGALLEDTRKQVEKMGIGEKVYFLGWRSDVERIFQAMDVFIFPSKFEGLGFVGIEAQLSGLPVVASDKVPDEIKITEDCFFLSLQDSPEIWADKVIESARKNRSEIRILKNIPEFDIRKQQKELKKIIEIGG